MSDKLFAYATIHAELHNLKLIMEQFQTILQSARQSNNRLISSLDKLIKDLEQPTDRNLSEGAAHGNNA